MTTLVLFRAASSLTAVTASTPAIGSAVAAMADARGGQLDQGRRLFAQQCASCHGPQGNRIPISPLDSQQYVDSLGNRLEEVITRGRGTMPAWGRDMGGPLDSKQVSSVAEFIRSKQGLSKRNEPAVAAVKPTPPPAASPTAEQPQAPPAIPHAVADQNNHCLQCHDRGASVPMPVNHAGRTESTCSFCHAQGPVTVSLPASSAAPVPTAPAARPVRTTSAPRQSRTPARTAVPKQ